MQQESFLAKGATYSEPRLGLSVPGRSLVRIISGATFALLGAAALMGILSDVPLLRGGGLLALLFFIERIVYRNRSERPLHTLLGAATPNLAPALSSSAYRIVERAYDASRITKQPLGIALLAQLLRDKSVLRALARTEADLDALAAPESTLLDVPLTAEAITAVLSTIISNAADVALALGQDEVNPVTLFTGLVASRDPLVDRTVTRARLTADDLGYAAQAAVLDAKKVRRMPRTVSHHIMNRAWTSRPTPALDRVSSDLTDLARIGALPGLVGHGEAYEAALQALGKVTHPHALLVAPTSGGKETIAGEVARAIVAGTAPGPLIDRRLVRIDVAALLGAGGAEPAALIKEVADEILVAGNIVLYIPDFEHLAQATGAYVAAADVLLPILTADTFPVLAATTPEAYARILETRGDIAGTFQVIRLESLQLNDTIAVLAAHAREIEGMHGIGISVAALRTAASLATRYLAPERPVPGSALDLLAETAQAVRQAGGLRVVAADVERTIERQTHVPVGAVQAEEADVLINLEKTLRARVIGQDEAVTAAAESVRAYRAGLVEGSAPASFLFVGPTGVGKTELAKALAEAVYGDNAFTRLDMSEFSEAGSVARLIGTSTQAGLLTDPVRISPHRLILLDELEKANQEAVRLLLQVTSDGRLTDGMGRAISFADTLIVATSNAHTDLLRDALRKGEGTASVEGYLRAKLSDVFPTELLNRFTRIVIFHDLDPDQLRIIAAMTITQIGKLLQTKYGVELSADAAALSEIVKRGYDPEWGARPLRRAAETALDSILAPELISGNIPRGSHVTLTSKDGSFALLH